MGVGDAALHRERKKNILNEFPEVRSLVGPDPSTQYYAYTVFLLQILICCVVKNSYLAAVVLGSTVAPYINFGILVLMHEVSHNLIFREKSLVAPLNRLLGIVCNMAMIVPISEIFRQHHNIHHQTLGDISRDVDVPLRGEVKFVGNSRIWKALWLAFNIFVLPIRSMKKLPVVWGPFMVLNWVSGIGFGFYLLIYYPPSFVYLMLGTVFSQSLHPANARAVQRHIRLFDDDRSEDLTDNVSVDKKKMNTFSYYGPMNAYTLNVGYHVEHHDFGNIAWTRLPELRRIVGEKWYPTNYAYNSRGVLDVMKFILDDDITLAGFADTYMMD